MDISIMCFTWNVAGHVPQHPDHFTLLAQLAHMHDASIVALALQESVNLNAASLGIATITPETQSGLELLLQVLACCSSMQFLPFLYAISCKLVAHGASPIT
jgi:hypothetical protein